MTGCAGAVAPVARVTCRLWVALSLLLATGRMGMMCIVTCRRLVVPGTLMWRGWGRRGWKGWMMLCWGEGFEGCL